MTVVPRRTPPGATQRQDQTIMSRNPKIGIRNVLLTTDFSSESARAVESARSLSRNYCAGVHVVHVMEIFPFVGRDDDEARPHVEQIRLLAEKRLKQFRDLHRLTGNGFEGIVLSGDAGTVIERYVREHDIDLTVLGSRGDAGVRRLFEGSVAEEIFRSVKCPVLVVGPNAKTRVGRFKRLVFATDLSRISKVAVPYIELLLSEDISASVVVAHFAEREEDGAYARHRARLARQHKLIELLKPKFRPKITDAVVEVFSPVDGISRLLKETSADVLILGVRPGGSFTRAATHVLGSITPLIVSAAPCPVLTVRAGSTDS